MHVLKTVFITLLMISFNFSAQAMKLEVRENQVFATGPVENDLAEFEKALALPGVDTVVFVNSPGGDLWTGLRVGRLIADKGLNTVIAGSCVSACSIMFMGGKERSFSDAFRPVQTLIGIHGAHNRDTKTIDAAAQPQIFAFYKLRMGESFNSSIMNQALYEMEDAGSLLRVFDTSRPPRQTAYHCRSAQTLRKNCTDFKDTDALKLGIITTAALTSVALPDSFRTAASLKGFELAQIFADPAAYFSDLTKSCATELCPKLISAYANLKENKALAVPVGASGLGTSADRTTPLEAAIGAIHACNHPKERPARLCNVQTVNGFDVRGMQAWIAAAHAEAKAKLVVPPERYYGNEEFGGLFASADALRTQKFTDTTPKEMAGARTIATRELATALKGNDAPVLIDVWGGTGQSIPGALLLGRGGFAQDDAAKDAAFELRFQGLLKLLAPDPSKPVVFYGQGRDSWLPINAALRARKLGYTQVSWYRGGVESWKAAGLPLVPPTLDAIVDR